MAQLCADAHTPHSQFSWCSATMFATDWRYNSEFQSGKHQIIGIQYVFLGEGREGGGGTNKLYVQEIFTFEPKHLTRDMFHYLRQLCDCSVMKGGIMIH